MKSGLYLCCVGFAVVVLAVEVSSQQSLLDEPVDNTRLYQNADAAAGKQSSSYLNVDGGYPSQNYFGSAQQAQPQFSAPDSWTGADANSQQSSESDESLASSNQYPKLIADGAYGYPSARLPSLQASQYPIGNDDQIGNSYYPTGGNSQYPQQNSQVEGAGSAQGCPCNSLEQQPQPQSQFLQYPAEYYGSPNK